MFSTKRSLVITYGSGRLKKVGTSGRLHQRGKFEKGDYQYVIYVNNIAIARDEFRVE